MLTKNSATIPLFGKKHALCESLHMQIFDKFKKNVTFKKIV